MRYFIVAVLLGVGCTAPNPLYDPLSAWVEEHPGTPDPRLPAPDMSIAPDLAQIDLWRGDACFPTGSPCEEGADCCAGEGHGAYCYCLDVPHVQGYCRDAAGRSVGRCGWPS